METIKVNFGYFWPDFDPADNYFTRILSRKYEVIISDDPELFIFTHAYNGVMDYLNYDCHRMFLGWENERADWNACDYVLDADFYVNEPRHKRWPLWAAWNPEQLVLPKNSNLFLEKRKFACMVVSNPKAKERIDFFQQLSKYKKVDSGGKYLNNIGEPVANKMDFIRDYKFVISFENSSNPGYTTEKLLEPMLVNSIPLYWGNPEVGRDFNTRSFIHINQYASYGEAIKKIIELDQDDNKYLEMLNQPWFKDNTVPDQFRQDSLESFFDFVISDMKTKPPVAKSILKTSLHKFQLTTRKAQYIIFDKLGMRKSFR